MPSPSWSSSHTASYEQTGTPKKKQSTREVLERLVEFNEHNLPLNDTAELVFPDMEKMYPNVDKQEGLDSVHRRLLTNPSPSVDMSPQYTVD